MRIAIIETGAPPEQLNGKHPSYPKMMERMLAPLAPKFSFTTYETFRNGALPKPADFDGLLITGSPAGVYEDHVWIATLEDLVRETAKAGKPQVGICFGHQLMAKAFGGEVRKSDKGWGVGVHHYDVTADTPWMAPMQGKISCAVSHQDQVITPPPGAKVIAGSDFCEFGALSFAQGPAISFQMHPEFEHDYASDLIGVRRNRFGETLSEEGLASLKKGSDRGVIARWIANFFTANA
ncbi:MAG TPA: homoserine O-succinyltransferase [Parvularculaceae bacterium]|nr:homoserine O-succinyltransferase [Parvularculaceae bacterium]